VCNFSSGISGVWTRVLEDSIEFVKRGHEVHIFSSNRDETGRIVSDEQDLNGIKIKRFPVKFKMGYALWFHFEEEAIELKPNVIICHGLRKPYLFQAIRVSKKIKAKCFLVTHAPFFEVGIRKTYLEYLVNIYDMFMGKSVMNSFDKVVSICKWEKDELLKRGCDEKRIVYIPNSISDEFFFQKMLGEEKKIIYMGRMNPVKKIEDLIEAFKKAKPEGYSLEIVSVKEGDYYESLVSLKNEDIFFTDPIFDLTEKIKKIDTAEIFVLPSKKESLPFGIIEAMARGKIVIATKTLGAEEIIEDKNNGFLIEIGDTESLSSLLKQIPYLPVEDKNKIMTAAKEKAQEFKVSEIMDQWEGLFK